jgi:hypothetical protein
MRRRDFIALTAGAAAAWPLAALAQTAKVYRVGTLTGGPAVSSTADRGAVLFDGLAKRGYVLGKNLVHEARGASGKLERVPLLMQHRWNFGNVSIPPFTGGISKMRNVALLALILMVASGSARAETSVSATSSATAIDSTVTFGGNGTCSSTTTCTATNTATGPNTTADATASVTIPRTALVHHCSTLSYQFKVRPVRIVPPILIFHRAQRRYCKLVSGLAFDFQQQGTRIKRRAAYSRPIVY